MVCVNGKREEGATLVKWFMWVGRAASARRVGVVCWGGVRTVEVVEAVMMCNGEGVAYN